MASATRLSIAPASCLCLATGLTPARFVLRLLPDGRSRLSVERDGCRANRNTSTCSVGDLLPSTASSDVLLCTRSGCRLRRYIPCRCRSLRFCGRSSGLDSDVMTGSGSAGQLKSRSRSLGVVGLREPGSRGSGEPGGRGAEESRRTLRSSFVFWSWASSSPAAGLELGAWGGTDGGTGSGPMKELMSEFHFAGGTTNAGGYVFLVLHGRLRNV